MKKNVWQFAEINSSTNLQASALDEVSA